MKTHAYISILCVLLCGCATVQTIAKNRSPATTPEIQSYHLAVLQDWTNALSPTKTIEYRVRQKAEPSQIHRAIILVPGGPGNSSDTDFLSFGESSLSGLADTQTILVFYSPRGANQDFKIDDNFNRQYLPDDFSLAQQAHDLKALGAHLRADYPALKDLWLYGFSHGGTVVPYTVGMFPKNFNGIALEDPALGFDGPWGRETDWLKSNPDLWHTFGTLRTLAREGHLNNVRGPISERDVAWYVGTAVNYLKYPNPDLAFISRNSILPSLKDCLLKSKCDFFSSSRNEMNRVVATISIPLAEIIECNELAAGCDDDKFKYKTPVAPYSAFKDSETQKLNLKVIIFKSTDDLDAENMVRITDFFKRLPTNTTRPLTLPGVGHSIADERPEYIVKNLRAFMLQ